MLNQPLFLLCACVFWLESSAQSTSSDVCPPEKQLKLNSYFQPIAAESDDFDKLSLDNNIWYDSNPMWQGREPGRFDKGNVSVQGGKLVLSITHGAAGFRSGSVVSRNTFLYGYFETRAKAAATNVTSSFWFYKEEPSIWTEIDIFENTGHSKYSHQSRSNIHAFRLPHIGKTSIESQTVTELKFDTSKTWATYGVEWLPSTINFYINGCRTAQHLNKHWHQKLHAVFDIEMMPDWIGLPSDEHLPSIFEIDYFRVWRFQPPQERSIR